MDLWNHEQIAQLWAGRPGIHVSLFMKLENEPDKQKKNRIRLKNLLATLNNELAGRVDDAENEAVTAMVPDQTLLLGDSRTNGQPGRGLSLFLAPDFEATVYLPYAPEEQLVLDRRFYIRPLLPLLEDREMFYLLTLSQKNLQLWQGNRFKIWPVETPNMPENIAETLALDDPERQLQFHTSSASGGAGGRPAMFFGHDVDSEKKGAILRYFHEVDAAVSTYLAGRKQPLFLGGVDYLLPIYAATNEYPHLQEGRLEGNLDRKKPAELHRPVWELAEPLVQLAQETAWKQFMNLQNTGRAVHTLAEVAPAAAYGRVQTLFTVAGREVYGRFDRENGEVSLAATGDRGPETRDGGGSIIRNPQSAIRNSEALVNLAVMETLKQDGAVFVFAEEDLENQEPFFDEPLAAILRY